METDWIGDLVASKRQEQEDRRFRNEKDLSDRRMLDAHSEAKWFEVWDITEKAVAEYIERMGKNCISFHGDPGRNKFSLCVGTQETDIRFDRQRWVLSSPYSVYALTVADGNEVVWKKHGSTQRTSGIYTSEKIVQEQLTEILRHS
jgi:hypothetical protein